MQVIETQTEEQITCGETAQKIVKRLVGLGVKGVRISKVITGPVVTAYPIEIISDNVPVAKILTKSQDLAAAIGVESVDIRRVGSEVYVYVPNKDRKTVDFKDFIFWYLKDEKVRNMTLPIPLGMGTEGENAAIDLAEQPHVLVAGSTGSGKSIFESAIIASITTMKRPDQLELYLVDTKGLDLALFSNLPHVKNTATTVEDWYIIINSLHVEVQVRNKKIAQLGVRNITEYNRIAEHPMPHCVMIIDELADLIIKDAAMRKGVKDYPEPKVIEALRRLVQICRAAGVHVIACTQRTSVDIISGVVKANFPTRISLRLPSGTDSRVILDQAGAENLLGKGDMLVQRADGDTLERYHGPFVRLEDIQGVLMGQDSIRESLGLIG